MDIFSVFTLFGGLAFFLYGMHVMSTGLEKMAGGSLERILKKMTSNPFKSLLLGAGITIAIQSSSAMTVMLVGLVNSGIMQLSQTIGVIMGSNIGTTLTAWILSSMGIESNNIFLKMLKPSSFAPIVALIGIILIMMSKAKKKKDIGTICIGFAVLMYGMELMSGAVSPLADMPEFASILTAFTNPIFGVLVGAVFTGIIQSSAASVGILQALSLTGGITYQMAIPIIMGQNIGTCVTAIISSIGVNKNAKRVSVVHISFNIIGTVICLCLFYGIRAIVGFSFDQLPIDPLGIAACHSIFNIASTVILLPMNKLLVKIATTLIRDKENDKEQYVFIDERLLQTPSFAISECNNSTMKMARLAEKAIKEALSLVGNYDTKRAEQVITLEDELDRYEDKLGTYLVKLSSKDISIKDSKEISKMLHTIGDFERIGDHAVNLQKVAEEIHEKKIEFSSEARQELHVARLALEEIITTTTEAFCNYNLQMANDVEPLEQVIDGLVSEIKVHHVERLQSGICTIQLGFVLADLLTNIERVSDHCSNVAVAMIETEQNSFDTHEYLDDVRHIHNKEFERKYATYQQKYSLRQSMTELPET